MRDVSFCYIFFPEWSNIIEGQAWCSGESCLTESPGRGFEAASPQILGGEGLPRVFPSPDPNYVGASGTGSAQWSNIISYIFLWRWFGHVQQRPLEATVHSEILSQDSNVKRGRGRPKLTWVEAIKGDLKGWNIPKDLALDRSSWKIALLLLL